MNRKGPGVATGPLAETIIGRALEVAIGRGLDAVLFSASAAVVDTSQRSNEPSGSMSANVATRSPRTIDGKSAFC